MRLAAFSVSIVALLAAACGAPDVITGSAPWMTAADAGAAVDTGMQGDRAPTPLPTDAAPTADRGAGHEGVSPADAWRAPDAGQDGAIVEGGADAQTPTADAGSNAEGGVPRIDAGTSDDAATVDGSRPIEAGTPDGSTIVDARTDAADPCPSAIAGCDAVNRTIADVKRTFPQPCTTNARKCGAVVDSYSWEAGQYVVTTSPLVCQAGAWTLAGSIQFGTWIAWYECSRGCTVNMLCDP